MKITYSVEISSGRGAVSALSDAEYAQIVASQDGIAPNFRAADDLPPGVDFAFLDDGRKIYRETN